MAPDPCVCTRRHLADETAKELDAAADEIGFTPQIHAAAYLQRATTAGVLVERAWTRASMKPI
jgi:hypothetical protein